MITGKKDFIIVLFLLLTVQSYSQTKFFINISRKPKNQFNNYYLASPKHYVIFSSHGPYTGAIPPDENSFAGHSWVMWAKENPQTKQTEISGYGFWPDRQIINGKVSENVGNAIIASTAIPTWGLYGLGPVGKAIGLAQTLVGGSLGSVPGKLREDLFGITYSKSLKQVVVEVDEDMYYQSQNVLNSYRDANPNYKLVDKDCTTFFSDVGTSLGFKMPARDITHPSSFLPDSYMDLFLKSLSDGTNLSFTENGKASAKADCTYKVLFDKDNKNVCEFDYAENLVEKKVRNGEASCQQIDYPNGDTWYMEATPPIQNMPIGPFNLPTSEYRFANGNTILGYRSLYYNPNFVAVNLNSGNQTYLGSIDNNGIPNGVGTLNTVDNNGFAVSSKTGVFINGNFTNYTGLNVGNGTAYGEFSNGELTGQAKIDFNDGRIYTGEFVKGKANGQGSITNRKGDFYLTGTFKNGSADGNCTITGSNGLYKGEMKAGACSGKGTLWAPNGVVFEGTFNNGFFVTGKATLPNGNFYLGDFDANGKPSGGKFFDKNGNEIKERERHGSEREPPGWIHGEVKMGKEAGDVEINGVKQ